jgi:hypothetical protein
MRFSSTHAGAAAFALALGLSTAIPGCGPGTPQVDSAALYTPESLAGELSLRYRTLKPEARKLTRGADAGPRAAKRAAALDRARQAEKKGGGSDVPSKRTGPATLDDVMADIDAKIDKVPGTPRAVTCRKMAEAIETDSSLSAEDKALLSGRLKAMGAS